MKGAPISWAVAAAVAAAACISAAGWASTEAGAAGSSVTSTSTNTTPAQITKPLTTSQDDKTRTSARKPSAGKPGKPVKKRAGVADPAAVWNAAFNAATVTSKWAGGDGVVSMSEGGQTWWLFGDSLVPHQSGVSMVTSAMLYSPKPGVLQDVNMPQGVFAQVPGGKHWPSAAVKIGPKTWVVAAQDIKYNPSAGWGFELVGSAMYTFQVDGAKVTRSQPVPTPQTATAVSWGAAMARQGQWVWILGTTGQAWGKDVLVARAPVNQVANPSSWQYHTANGWSANPREAVAVIGTEAGMPYHFSLTQVQGRWVIVAKQHEGLGQWIVALNAAEVTGPWSKPVNLVEAGPKGNVMLYAALAHPQLSKQGQLLVGISRNDVGEGSLARVSANPGVYRPQFYSIPHNQLLP